MKGALRTTENTLGQKVEAAVKAGAKRSDEERKKAAAAERKELEKALGQQVVQVRAMRQQKAWLASGRLSTELGLLARCNTIALGAIRC